ncbi:GNAT family N-acetyltransferase [Prosthecodimorpha staleyi]|uniref:GNAT family N-acetyltransferase n=1 Tax=Prosthecodimorpha staleyi TaxID=2840188 RepID=A0A947D1W7_9HYPH|nr:GNAT family N-acetyltransferase [Prosthecodimorpha staleyi]MBT9288819.1 GNAT family N-acetyltransferase [Prosthecodimorpha staleyi]
MDHRNTLRGLFPFDSAYLPEMADVWVESWQRTMPSIDFETRRGWLVDHLIAAADAGQTIRCALVETGEIAGFVLIDTATGYLDQIVVGSPWWGKGLAEALLDEARRLAPGRIELDVNQDNPRAVAFYMRNGFQVIAEGMNAKSGLATLKLEWKAAARDAGLL